MAIHIITSTILIFVFILNFDEKSCQEFSQIGDALESFNPCGNGILYMDRLIGGPPNKENYWNGYLSFDEYPNLSEVRIEIKFDSPANITVDENEGRVNTLDDSFHITYFKNDEKFKREKFRVTGAPRGKFPNIEYLKLNGYNVCPNVTKWSPTILGPSSQGSLINDDKIENENSTNIRSNTQESCGRRQIHYQGLILSGYPSKEGDWPWHTAVYHRSSNTNFEYKCGGTLISMNSVLTASHCVIEGRRFMIANRILVRLGQYNRLVGGRYTQEFSVFKIIPHSEFGFDDFKNDIAILKLATEVTLSPYVQPTCLWPRNNTDLENVLGQSGFVVGWGFSTKNELSDVLLQAQMPIVSFIDCLKSNRDFFGAFLSDKNYCAGSRNGTSVCNGDSGGGMFFKYNGQYFIRGIVSLSVSKENEQICDSRQYVIFTDVAQHLDWIDLNSKSFNENPSFTNSAANTQNK